MARNWCLNSSFEKDTAGTWAASGVATLSRSQTGTEVDGTWHARLTGTGSGNPSLETEPAAYIPTTEGEEWTVSVHLKWITGTPKPCHVDVRWRDAAGAVLSTQVGGNFTPSDSAWIRIPNNDNAAPAGTAYLSVRIVVVGIVTSDVVAIDAVMAEKGNFELPSPYTRGPDEDSPPLPAKTPTYPLIQFVAEPDSSPTVLYDCNTTDGIYVTDPDFSDFDLGAPDAEYEPEVVNVYDGYRTFPFTLCVDTGYTDAAAELNALSKVLTQPKGWIMVQREALHQPMFLRWYRSQDQPMSWEQAKYDIYTLPIELICDPYLRGEPVVLATQTVVNDPGGATNPAQYEFPAIKGDVPAPLKVDIVPDATLGPDWTDYQPFMASVAYLAGTAWDGPILWPLLAADFTAGVNTGADTADATYVAGSYRLTTFANGNMDIRLSGEPATTVLPGLYKVLARVALTDDAMTVRLKFGQVFNLNQVDYGPTVEIVRPTATNQVYETWVDLGEQMFPFGAQNIDPTVDTSPITPQIELSAQRVSGAGNLRWDSILLIPLATVATARDSITQTSRFHGFGIENLRNGVWDGELQRFAAYNLGIGLANIRAPEPRGGWLKVVPGANNVFILLQQSLVDTPFFTNVANDGDTISNEADVRLSYLPRYLHLRPDTE